MSGYTKLFSSIIHSTVWREPDHVRIVWITMLAMTDREGSVESSVPGLADAARVDMAQCVDALERLSSPDPYSRTTDFDGRRVEKIDGGWEILNYELYRQRASVEDRRRKNAEKQQRYRDRKRKVENDGVTGPVTDSNQPLPTVTGITKSNPIAEADAEADADKTHTPKRRTRAKHDYTDDFERFFKVYPNKVDKFDAFNEWQGTTDRPDTDELIAIIEKRKQSELWTKENGKFIVSPFRWLKKRRWEDVVDEPQQQLGAAYQPFPVEGGE